MFRRAAQWGIRARRLDLEQCQRNADEVGGYADYDARAQRIHRPRQARIQAFYICLGRQARKSAFNACHALFHSCHIVILSGVFGGGIITLMHALRMPTDAGGS